MRRNLAAGLNERFNNIVGPLLRDSASFSTRDECKNASEELNNCLELLGKQHYMYDNIKARKLFMDAMALTWGLSESEYNISLKPDVERSIRYLEQSEELEPNASYTISALGVRYFFIYEFDKAFAKFQKYLDLRPYDFSAKYSLVLIYKKLKQFEKAEELLKKLLLENKFSFNIYTQLFEVYYLADQKEKALKTADYIKDSLDEYSGFFLKGIYYSKEGDLENAVKYYQVARTLSSGGHYVDNNIGHIYFVHDMIDSARQYFKSALAGDSTSPFPIFNLATLDAIDGKYDAAMMGFAKSVDYSATFTEAFVTHLEKYFGKTFTVKDSALYKEFTQNTFIYDLQWAGYTSILYCFIRNTGLSYKPDSYEYVFNQLFNYKEQEVFTWYHHACYKAINNDKKAALESIERSLKLGFSSYFQLTSDDDLALIRDTPEFKQMLEKYFPSIKK
jgi:tetratricopeptide (TPR) repeat protein